MPADAEADALIAKLGLKPLEIEGGYFVETYRSSYSTAIYYLLTADLIRRYPDRADLITNLTTGRDDHENTK